MVFFPFLQPIFGSVPVGGEEWRVVGPLLLVPTVAAELTKALVQRFGARRTRAWRGTAGTAA